MHNPEARPPDVPETAPDPTLIDGFDHFTGPRTRHRVVNSLQTSRGCHFHCRFCPTSRLFGGSFRTRPVESIIADIRSRIHLSPFFFVVDNSFLGDRKHAIELLHRLIREDLGARFIIFERHQIGADEELLMLMKRAGVRCVIVGIESLADENLQQYDKRQSSATVTRSVESLMEHGMHVIGTFVLGGDGDTRESADRIADFVEATGISLNLFVMHDLETDGSKDLLVPLNRRFMTHYERTQPGVTAPWDYMTGSFVTYYPARIRPSALQEAVLSVYEKVFSHGRIVRRAFAPNLFEATFGVVHGYGVKRLTDSIRRVVDSGYGRHLREIEDGLYREDDTLIVERLESLTGLPLPPSLNDQVNVNRYESLVPLLALPGLVRAKWTGGL